MTERALPVGRVVLADNLEFLRALPDACIDLMYADPPFGTGRTHRAPTANRDGATFDDTWAGDVQAYLAWLRPRFSEMWRALSPHGVLWLHCDWHAGHYIKVLLDEICGRERFQNEVIWHYGLGASAARRHLLRKHDTLFVYTRSAAFTFNVQRGDVTPAMQSKYCHEDERGRYMMSRGRRYYLRGGKPLDSVWAIPAIAATSRERLGYPTQKPEALLERIILLSSDPADVVADPFCGSGTTAAVAARLGRRWTACDDSPEAVAITSRRLGLSEVSAPAASASARSGSRQGTRAARRAPAAARRTTPTAAGAPPSA